MPAVINLDYKLPERENEKDSIYILKVINDIKFSLIQLNPKEEHNLLEVLEIIKAGSYISRYYQIPHKVDLSKIKNLIKDYEKKSKKTIEQLLEEAGQFLLP